MSLDIIQQDDLDNLPKFSSNTSSKHVYSKVNKLLKDLVTIKDIINKICRIIFIVFTHS